MRRLLLASGKDISLWEKLTKAAQHQHMPQALLLIVPPALSLVPLVDRLLATFLCVDEDKPCGNCLHCHKILLDTHPDVHTIQPESAAGQIKIEQIRHLQQSLFQTPQLGTRGIVVIQPADALNVAAASALLKILEEPPATMICVLVTTQPSLLLPTLTSRCQPYRVIDATATLDPLSLGQTYPEGSVRERLYQQRLQLLADFDAYGQDNITVCTLVERWSAYPLQDILWFLYALTAKLINGCLIATALLEVDYQPLKVFKQPWPVTHLFKQLDSLQTMMEQLQRNITLNAALALEKVLLAYREDGTTSC